MTGEAGPGYKKPPKATQFKAGVSGNPTGRPKGSRSIIHELQAELLQEVTVGGVQLTKQALVARGLVNAAIKGDMRAIECILRLSKNSKAEDTPESEASHTPAIEKFLSRQSEKQGNEGKDSK